MSNTDDFFGQMIKAAETKARKNVRDEVSRLRKENAALRKKVAAFPDLQAVSKAERSKLALEWERFRKARSRLVLYSKQLDRVSVMSLKSFLYDSQWGASSRGRALSDLKKQETRIRR